LEGSAQALVSDPSDFGGDWCIELDGRCVNFDPVWDLVGGINGDQGSSPPGVSVEVGTSRRIQDGVESNDGAEYPTILFKINTCWLMNGEHSLRFRYKPSEVTRVWSNLATKWSPEVSFRVACAKTSQISSLDSGVWISPDPDRRSAGIYLVASVVRPKSLSISISSGRFEKKKQFSESYFDRRNRTLDYRVEVDFSDLGPGKPIIKGGTYRIVFRYLSEDGLQATVVGRITVPRRDTSARLLRGLLKIISTSETRSASS
jgi:hypothetical protein